MRIDKFLKIARVLKRRSIAKELGDQQRIYINQKPAKPSREIYVGDVVDIMFGHRKLTIKVLDIKPHPSKKDAQMLYEVLDEVYDSTSFDQENSLEESPNEH